MAFLFADSFDHYATADITAKWTSQTTGNPTLTISGSAGRRGTSGFRISQGFAGGWLAYLKKTVNATGSGFVQGAWVQFSAVPGTGGTRIAAISESGTNHLLLRVNNDYTISVLRGDGTVLGTSTASGLANGIGGYVEWKGTIASSTGSYTVRVNNTTILTGTSKNTQNGGTGAWNGFALGNATTAVNDFSGSMTVDFDDLYLLDQSGAAHNDFYGDVEVGWHPVTGAGNSTQFTPSAGANYTNVDDATPDGDATKNTASAVGNKDTFALTNLLSPGGSIKVVQTVLSAAKSAAGICTLSDVIRHSGADYDGTAQSPSTSYSYYLEGHEVNPGTGAAWTESGFNAIELGYKQVT